MVKGESCQNFFNLVNFEVKIPGRCTIPMNPYLAQSKPIAKPINSDKEPADSTKTLHTKQQDP